VTEEAYADVAGGVVPLINVYAMFVLSPEGSPEEKQAEDALAGMVETLSKLPDSAGNVISALLAIMFELRAGGNIHDALDGVFPLVNSADPDATPH
jgi:hypothetical protein